MCPVPESNGFIKERSYILQGLALQELLLMYAVCPLLLFFGCSFSQVSPLQNFSLPQMGSVWLLSIMW